MEDFESEASGVDSMQALIDELKKPQYQALDNQAVADLLNALTIERRKLVVHKEIIKWAIDLKIYGRVNADMTDPAVPKQQREDLWNIKGWVDNPANKSEFADLHSATALEMIGNLIRYGYCDQSQAQQLSAMGLETVRWLDDIGVGQVSAESIKDLRDEASGLKARRHQLMQAGAMRWNAFVNAVDALKLNDSDPVL